LRKEFIVSTRAETLREAFDLACPNCGQANVLDVQITCMAHLTADGTDPHGDHEWDDRAACRCTRCGHRGTIGTFRTDKARAEMSADQHEYLFDAKLFAAFRISASSEDEARRLLTALLDCPDVHCGALPDGSPLTAEASLDGELDLVEVDGELPSR
jgi:DNA-directed RNA polymerase subunit RPC12/RpoP